MITSAMEGMISYWISSDSKRKFEPSLARTVRSGAVLSDLDFVPSMRKDWGVRSSLKMPSVKGM